MEEIDFQKQELCVFCNKRLNENRVRDHDHYTGIYEGGAHQFCNVKAFQMFKGKTNIPIVFHNANYDIKCFMSAFQELKGDDAVIDYIGGIPCNMEIFKSININSYSIIYSYAHLSSLLDKLIKNLPSEKKVLLRTLASNDEEFALINKKGFYPYELITSQNKLFMPITELRKDHFNSKLTLSTISDSDFEHVQKVIKTFGITNFKKYHDLYLK